MEAGAIPPFILARRAESKVFAVPFKGFPVPQGVVLKSGQALQEPVHLKPVQVGNKMMVEMENLQPEDVGEYELVLKNAAGEARTPFKLQVLTPPHPPKSPLEVADLSKTGCTLKWKAPENDGGTPLTAYKVDKMDLSQAPPKWEPIKEITGQPPEQSCPVKLK